VATDKLTIDTPEQVHLEFGLANLGSRFMAIFADTLIQFVAFLVLYIIDGIVLNGAMFSRVGTYRVWVRAVIILADFCVLWGYFAFFEALWKGQTPGKRWAGIRVIKETGRPIDTFEAIARNFLRAVDWFPGFYGVGIVTMLLNSKNRRLGDFVAGTLVVHDKTSKDSDLFFNTSRTKADMVLYQATRLSVQEIELIETFLARRLDIPSEVRKQNAVRIAEMIGAKLGIGVDSRPADNENFLELVVQEFRNHAQFR